jgi:Fe2+ or Zn2+ uptake regulation protein
MTRTRRAVLALLERTPQPLSASEIFSPLQKDHVSIVLVTVYRTVNVLKELGLVVQLEIVDLLLCPLKKLTKLIEKRTQFVVDDHTLEFSGFCPKCQ